jgi:hypothetical protein
VFENDSKAKLLEDEPDEYKLTSEQTAGNGLIGNGRRKMKMKELETQSRRFNNVFYR